MLSLRQISKASFKIFMVNYAEVRIASGDFSYLLSERFKSKLFINTAISSTQTSCCYNIMGKKGGNFYAVARGRSVGVYATWDECKSQVDGFQNARYKKFSTLEEANGFIQEHQNPGTRPSESNAVKKLSSLHSKPSSSSATLSTFQTKPIISTNTSVFKSTGQPQKRNFSDLKVTGDRVTNKRAKLDIPNAAADLKKFTIDDDGYVVVFTDGACSGNGNKIAKAGIGVWFGDNHSANISEPVHGTKQTNNTAEIQATERAIVTAKENGINKLNIKTDSQFTINCVTKWLYNWKRNGWKLSNGQDVKNKEDLIKLDNAMNNMEIKWSYVAGHAGVKGNEAADRLAVAGAEKMKRW